ncbi:MAG: DMT family transporter [Pirellula sp.]|nr:DMT family transporter [Pirellula sp.]
MNHSRSVRFAILALIGVNALWGLSFPVMKSLNEIMDRSLVSSDSVSITYSVSSSAGMIAVRFSMAMLLITILLPKLVLGAKREEWVAGFWIGLLFCIGLVLQVIGLSTIPASRSGFLTSLTAVYTPLMYAVMTRRLPSLQLCIGILLALVGVATLSNALTWILPQSETTVTETTNIVPLNWGDLWTTLGAIFFSIQVLLIDHFGSRYRSASFTPGMFATATLVAAAIFTGIQFFPQGNSSSIELSKWTSLILQPAFLVLVFFLALFCSLVSFLGMNTYQPYITASQASVIYSTEPLFASLWAMILPGVIASFIPLIYQNESATWQLIVGGLFILAANVIALWPSKSERTEVVPT